MGDLTLDSLKQTIADVNRRFPPPAAWIYGIEFGQPPWAGPLGVSLAELSVLVLDRLVTAEYSATSTEPRWYWTPKGRAAMLAAMEENNATR